MGGKGHLTDSVIDSLTVYFGEAIRNFPGKPCFTIQYRMMINITTSFSPSGSGSWCKFNRALADNEEPPKHIPKLPKDLGPFIKPVFTELSKRKLLGRCVLGAIQNQNESFNNINWSRCPNTGFCSLVSVDVDVSLAVITFNHGLKGLSPLCNCLVLPQVPLQLTT